ncbi:response regulator transcription factor [Calothrix sp. UHCC 0171]|uniref:response regulator transcription factor n=1 Tax=Calothrix sp. UHCC 0171 TaxID=3110245 RepID=UPI002B214FAC|nr:response regulator transcription factor [Calothrix sp. UHCC 0171]MEA5569643.1 response regulator transcription factor [Calothrix sp. UHCC 0171]
MPLTILVVDDDLGTRLSICDYLELSGYSVIVADDGQQALGMVEQYHPDLIVTDIVMPRMNGYELVRRVRQQPIFRLLPVILLTGRTKTQERILGYQSGCDLYLPKPFELEELAAAIRNLLERSQIIQSEYRLSQTDQLESENFGNPHSPSKTEENYHHKSISSPIPLAFESLSVREQEVLRLLTEGLSNIEMGDKLHLSPRTVEKYVSSLLRKTETSNRAQLVRFAIKHGLVE